MPRLQARERGAWPKCGIGPGLHLTYDAGIGCDAVGSSSHEVGFEPLPSAVMFELVEEREDATGCSWTLQRLDAEGRLERSRMRLGWADYGVWSPDGGVTPVRVAEAVIAFALDRPEFDPLPDPFDAAMARRRVPDADARIGRLIR